MVLKAKRSIRIGILCEDMTDCEVVDVLVRRIGERSGAPTSIWSTQKRAGNGCAKLVRRVRPWLRELAGKGCVAAIIVHDLDRNAQGELNNETELRRHLEGIEVPSSMLRMVCIPVEEIEAWFFSSPRVLGAIAGSGARPRPSPHLIRSPKEELSRLSVGANKRPRYSANDNVRYAQLLELEACERACPAFADLADFVAGLLPDAHP